MRPRATKETSVIRKKGIAQYCFGEKLGVVRMAPGEHLNALVDPGSVQFHPIEIPVGKPVDKSHGGRESMRCEASVERAG